MSGRLSNIVSLWARRKHGPGKWFPSFPLSRRVSLRSLGALLGSAEASNLTNDPQASCREGTAPVGREPALAYLFRKIRELYHLADDVDMTHVSIKRTPYECPLCGGVVFPEAPGRDNGEEGRNGSGE